MRGLHGFSQHAIMVNRMKLDQASARQIVIHYYDQFGAPSAYLIRKYNAKI
jgi:hypothetical protein